MSSSYGAKYHELWHMHYIWYLYQCIPTKSYEVDVNYQGDSHHSNPQASICRASTLLNMERQRPKHTHDKEENHNATTDNMECGPYEAGGAESSRSLVMRTMQLGKLGMKFKYFRGDLIR